jgi:hypothetical protein
MAKAVLKKLSVCECKFPLLSENIQLGTEYEIDLEARQSIGLICGGCNKTTHGIDGVYVYGREPGHRDGFLPFEVFELV